VIPRTAILDDDIDGHHIPKGSTMIVPVNAVHHDPRWWDDPGAYDPSRFMPGADKDRHRFSYLPFGAGQRVCIGMSFALMEGTLIAAMMTQRFRFDVVPGHPVQPEATLTLRPRNGVRMIAHQRTTAR
jgi:cytochrome P450